MNLQEYKNQTLARPDVKDIVKIEPVERDRTGQVVVLRTETGRDIIKYDVHLMREVDGVTQFDKEQIAVIDKGKPTEEIQFRSPTTAPKKAVTSSEIEKYIKRLPFINPTIEQINENKEWVIFRAIQETGTNAGKEVRVFAYRKGETPTYLILE